MEDEDIYRKQKIISDTEEIKEMAEKDKQRF